MRALSTIDAHSDSNGGAYWVDGGDSTILTQGRNGVVKLHHLGPDGDVTFVRTINSEEDTGFCTCDLTWPNRDSFLVAMPQREGAIVIHDIDETRFRFSPDKTLKLGMVMTIKFALVDDQLSRIVAGYEDGSVVLWHSGIESPVYRTQVFDSPVMALDFDPILKLGFCGAADTKLHSFALTGDAISLTRSTEVMNEGISALKLRSNPDFPRILAAGGWDSKTRVFQVPSSSNKPLKPLALLDSHKKTIRSLDFETETGVLAVASDDSHVSLWKLYCKKKSK